MKFLQYNQNIIKKNSFLKEEVLVLKPIKSIVMKKFVVFCVVCVVSLLGYYASVSVPKEQTVEDILFLKNIEALAQGEGMQDIVCLGEGTIDCFGDKVWMKITDLSYMK